MAATFNFMEPPQGMTKARHILLVQERDNPSSNYFIFPLLHNYDVRYHVIQRGTSIDDAMLDGAYVIFVRYVPRLWMHLLRRQRQRIAGIAYFMDDDLFDLSATAGTPLRYRFKLARLATLRKAWLRKMGAELWVANRFLADKYAGWRPRLIMPLPAPGCPDRTLVRLFYHGSASHQQEIDWLFPLVRELLAQSDGLCFEIIGGSKVNRLFRRLPRVSVVHPMSWPSYLAFCCHGKRDIGLAPLLPGPFNAGRAYTKFFDITRCGAAGIYGNMPPFADFVRHGEDGLLVDCDHAAWRDAILRLAADAPMRQRLYEAARNRLAALGDAGGHAL